MNIRVSTVITILIAFALVGMVAAAAGLGYLYTASQTDLATSQADLLRIKSERDRLRTDLSNANGTNADLRSQVVGAEARATSAEEDLTAIGNLICINTSTFNYSSYDTVGEGLADFDEMIWGDRPTYTWYLPWFTSRTAYFTMLYNDGLTTEYVVYFNENTADAVFAAGVFEVNSECWVDAPEW